MRQKKSAFVFSVLILFSVALPFSYSGPKDLDELIGAFEKDPIEEYNEVLESFITHAKNTEIKQMISLTSHHTIKKE